MEHLLFADKTFKVVLASFMMHHLPPEVKRAGLQQCTVGMSDEVSLLTYDQPSSLFLPGVPAAPPTDNRR